MDKMEVTWRLALNVWWSFAWRAMVLSALFGAGLGFVGGIVVALMGMPDQGPPVGAVLGYLGSIPVSVWVMKMILGKQFKNYSLAVVRTADI